MLQSIRHDEMTDICHLEKDTEKKSFQTTTMTPDK